MLTRNPKLEEFLPYARPRKNSVLTILLIVLWFVVVWGLLSVIPVGSHFYPQLKVLYLPLVLGGGAGLASLWWRLKASRINNRGRLAKADADPVLLLRPFYDNPPKPPLLMIPFTDSTKEYRRIISGKTPENFIATTLRRVGPVIAVGMPNEESPLIGPIALYFSDQEWRKKVEKLISISQLVVVQAGVASGLEWEMKTAKKMLRPDQLIVSLKTWKSLDASLKDNAYEVFSRNAERIFGVKFPPEHIGAEFIFFDSNWTPRLARRGLLKAVARQYESVKRSGALAANEARFRLPEVEFAKYVVTRDTSFDFGGTVRTSAFWTNYVGKYSGLLLLGIIFGALAVVLIIGYQIMFADRIIVADKSGPTPKVENVKSLLDDVKWTRFKLSDKSIFTLELPGKPTRITKSPALHVMFAQGRRSDFSKMDYPWYEITVYVEHYDFSNDLATFDEINESALKRYKDETVKVFSVSTNRVSDGVLYLQGDAQAPTSIETYFGTDEGFKRFQFSAAVSIKDQKAVVVFVLFSASMEGNADAVKTVDRIINSLR